VFFFDVHQFMPINIVIDISRAENVVHEGKNTLRIRYNDMYKSIMVNFLILSDDMINFYYFIYKY